MAGAQREVVSASAQQEVAHPRPEVWDRLARLLPYCSVCDVTYESYDTIDGDASGLEPHPLSKGTRFRAFTGKLDEIPEDGGVAGEVVEFDRGHRIATRLDPAQESALLRIDLADASDDTTLVTITVEFTPRSTSRLTRRMTRRTYERLAESTVRHEFERLPAHLDLA